MMRHLWYRIKWKFNIDNIRQRYANFCGRLKKAKNSDCIAADWDTSYIHSLRSKELKQ